MQTFKLFVSSPSDAMVERRRVDNVVSRLNGEFAGVARLETIRWETQYYQAYSTFQDQIPSSTNCDLVIGILKWRLGTELPPDFKEKLADGRPFPSGTAYEILTANEKRRRGDPLPDIYVFRFVGSSPPLTVDDPNRQRIEHDWQTLKGFFQEWFLTEQGHFKGAFNPYTSEDDFEAQLEKLLRGWVATKVTGGRLVRWPVEVKGSPFCGLAAFGAKHAPVFFGRSHDITRAIDLWREAGDRGAPYLLIVGSSGAGKSSLARAGLLPRLTTPGVINQVDIWRCAVMRPGDSPHGPFAALAAALLQDIPDLPKEEEGRGPALPEIALGDFRTPAELAPVLRHADAVAVKSITNALARVAAAGRDRESYGRDVRCDLVLLVDQLDELFAASVSEAEPTGFIALLDALARTGRIWVVATLRADFYARMLDQPDLKKLKEAGATYDLAPPGPVELAEIVRGPAQAADLVYETDPTTGESLDARLLRDADRPDMLPLVQLALSRLFAGREAADGKLLLPLKVYDGLGGLKGIVDEAGETALASVGNDEKARLPRLLRQLAIPAHVEDGAGKGALTIRAVPMSQAASNAAARTLVDALVSARLLTTSGVDADAQVRLAHQRVLEDWGRARTIVVESADFYRVRAEVEDSFRKWVAGHRRSELLLPRGLPLAEAENIVAKYANEVAPDLVAYVRASRTHANRLQMIGWAAAAAFALVAIGAGIAAKFAHDQSVAADAARTEAQGQTERAERALSLARENESRGLAALSRVAAKDGSFIGSIDLALAGWPRDRADPRPLLGGALLSLELGLSSLVPVLHEYRHGRRVEGVRLNRDETRILSWSADATLRLWDLATGRQIGPALKHNSEVTGALFTRDEARILTWSQDKTLRLWDAANGRQIGPPMTHDGWVSGALLNKDETRILSWSSDKTLRLWDVATGQQIGPAMMHDNWVYGARLTRDETRILSRSADGTVRMWDAASGRQIGPTIKHEDRVNGALMNKDETHILSWSDDKTLRLWDVGTGQQIGPTMRHDAGVRGALLTQDETRILSWSLDGTVRWWDVGTGRQTGTVMKHDFGVNGALLTGDETRILSWSADGTVRMWGAANGAQIGPPMKHDSAILGVALTRDETRILSWSADKTARLWDLATGLQIGLAMTHEGVVEGALLTRDETRAVSWSSDGSVRLWDVAIGRQAGPSMKHDDAINGTLLTRDESRIVSWSRDKTVRLWDAETGRQIGPAMQHGDLVVGALLTRDETRILSWSDDKTLRLWNVATGAQIGPAMTHDDRVVGVLLTSDETRILSWSEDNTLRLWETATSRQIGPAMQHDEEVIGGLLTRDETRILSWSRDKTLRQWDLASGRQIGPSMQHDELVSGALLTHDGTRILSWSLDGVMRLWDLATGRQIGEAMKHDVKAALMTHDDARILSWSSDKTLRLWDVATGQQIGPAMKHGDSIEGALLNRDETRILSWSRDGTVRLWRVATGGQIGPPMWHDLPPIGAMFNQDETRILSWGWDSTARLWDVATTLQIGPALQHGALVKGALLTRDENRIVSWSNDGTVRRWDASWRGRNLPEIACNHSPADHDLSVVSARYGVKIADPICQPDKTIPVPVWASIKPTSAN